MRSKNANFGFIGFSDSAKSKSLQKWFNFNTRCGLDFLSSH